ncbi:DNRLRE domain-containing protein [bacterium]|nr:DNRLRE domain-containing protein [bacterium]
MIPRAIRIAPSALSLQPDRPQSGIWLLSLCDRPAILAPPGEGRTLAANATQSRNARPRRPAQENDRGEATLTRATLKVYVVGSSYQTVNLHRLTRDWDEATVTWNSFGANDGGAYDPTVLGAFTANFGASYASLDVTDPVLAWMNGEVDNFGFLLRQPLAGSPRTEMLSRERASNRPVLELTFVQNGQTQTAVIEPLADAQINEAEPATAFGRVDKLYAGWREAGEKVSLIRFDIEVLPPGDDDGQNEGDGEGCTHSIGYWWWHSGVGCGQAEDLVTPLIGNGIWLGAPHGPKSLGVGDARVASRVLGMRTFGHPLNGITRLYAQLLTAKLNIANGTDPAVVAQTIVEADAFLTLKGWPDWRSLTLMQRLRVLAWSARLAAYNWGLIGPGHCG